MARLDPPEPLLHGHPLNGGPTPLAESIGHAFANAALAEEALTHRSALRGLFRHAARSTARTTRASVHTRATTHGSKPIYTASVQQTL